MKPQRILQVVMKMDRGGAETMLMNHYRKLDRSKFQFDFLVHRLGKGDYDDEILAMGGHIFVAPRIFPGNYRKYKRFLIDFLKEHHDFIAIHGHIQENSGFILYYAKKMFPEVVRVSHSHVAKIDYDLKYPFRLYANWYLKRSEQIKMACGRNAGRLFYGNENFLILKNAIDSISFQFSEQVRKEVREKLNIREDETLLVNVARFSPSKNHSFMVELCRVLNEKYKIVTIGHGGLEEKIRKTVKKYGLESRFLFAGLQTNIGDYLSTADIFIMPSLFEGLPVSGIEAQANGLPCLFSDRVDKETDITGRCRFLPLELSIWKKAIEATSKDRIDTSSKIIQAGYNVENNLKELLKVYTSSGANI